MERVSTHFTFPQITWAKRLNLKRWIDVWTERRDLERLDARMLADIGLTVPQARQESARAPWDIPDNRND